ncbi:alcohol dehydrogenase catalytic domain-containing protein [Streptomyces sp. NPDC004284]|uniref:alcohol dehydrogenase catalytic domain-containing protein n=1 Tax=Streptomyces sp. NPDC004284 TaxID=3364695 RepID=UPI00369C00EF
MLVRVHTAGLNPPDRYARRGFDDVPATLRPNRTPPLILGSDVSGVIAALGPGVTEWQPGDEVFGLVAPPSPLSERGCVP